MGLFNNLMMSVLSESLVDYTRKEKINTLGNRALELLFIKGKVTLREVQSEFDAIIRINELKGTPPIKEKKRRKPRKLAKVEKTAVSEAPKRDRKPKVKTDIKPKRKYTRRQIYK